MLREITQAIADTRREFSVCAWETIAEAQAAAVVAVIRDYDYLPDPFILAIPGEILGLLTVKQVAALGFAMAGAVVGLIGGTDGG